MTKLKVKTSSGRPNWNRVMSHKTNFFKDGISLTNKVISDLPQPNPGGEGQHHNLLLRESVPGEITQDKGQVWNEKIMYSTI